VVRAEAGERASVDMASRWASAKSAGARGKLQAGWGGAGGAGDAEEGEEGQEEAAEEEMPTWPTQE
jgi:hypothetical protein